MKRKGSRVLAASAALGAAVLGTQAIVHAAAQGAGATVQAPMFVVDPLWPRPMPNHWLLGSATGVAVDSRDHVFVIHLTDSFTARTEIGLATNPPTGECCAPAPNVLEFDPDGRLVNSWGGPGAGFDWPSANHGLAIDPEGNLWLGGMGGLDSRILKFTRDGKFIAQYGVPAPMPEPAARGGAPADTAYAGVSPGRAGRGGGRGGRGGTPAPSLPPNSASTTAFGGPAAFAFDAQAREVFVADGYRNRRVAVVDLGTGAIKRYFGAYGAAPNDAPLPAYSPSAPNPRQFATPVRCVERATDGTLYVCDARNNRIQVFGRNGAFVKEARVMPATLGQGAVWDLAFSRDPQQRYLYVADGSNMKIHVLDRQSLEVLTSFGDGGRYPGQFLAVSGVATDSKGNLYTVEGSEGKRLQRFVYQGIGTVSRDQGVLWPKKQESR